MPYKRRRDKTRDPQITPTMIKLFVEYRRTFCTCDPNIRFDECPGCKRRKELEDHLSIAFAAGPWEFPCIKRPADLENPQGVTEERWIALERAARELRRVQSPSVPPVVSPS